MKEQAEGKSDRVDQGQGGASFNHFNIQVAKSNVSKSHSHYSGSISRSDYLRLLCMCITT